MVVVTDLTKIYDDLRHGPQTALEGLTFSASAGEVFGLLGPNGAGKTTALRLIATLIAPSRGTAVVAGRDIRANASQVRHRIGYVGANTALHDRMTATETVEFSGQLHGLERVTVTERRAKLFADLAMEDFADVPCGRLSTGMKQKVAIARAMIHDPPVLIFDEATNGLDILVARTLLETVGTLRDRGKCVLFSSHIMREVERLCDRVLILDRGRTLAVGRLDDLAREHGQPDLELLFFTLIDRHRDQARSPVSGTDSPTDPAQPTDRLDPAAPGDAPR